MKSLFEKPWYVLAALLALPMLVFGLYFVSPWYPLSVFDPSAGIFSQIVNTQIEKFGLGIFYILVPAFTLVGVAKQKRKWIKAGSFGMFLVYIFASLIRLVILGPIPITWLFILTLGLISGLVRLVLR